MSNVADPFPPPPLPKSHPREPWNFPGWAIALLVLGLFAALVAVYAWFTDPLTMDLNGKQVVVTGGSSGIGKAIAMVRVGDPGRLQTESWECSSPTSESTTLLASGSCAARGTRRDSSSEGRSA